MVLEGKKSLGRILRKNDSILSTVKVTEFDFQEISKAKILYPDNPSGNILLTKLHQRKSLDEGVTEPNRFFEPLLDEPERVLKPLDFTEDWTRERNRMSKKGSKMFDDDEDLDFDLEAALRGQNEDDNSNDTKEGRANEDSRRKKVRHFDVMREEKKLDVYPDPERLKPPIDDIDLPAKRDPSQQVYASDKVNIKTSSIESFKADLPSVPAEPIESIKTPQDIIQKEPTKEPLEKVDQHIRENSPVINDLSNQSEQKANELEDQIKQLEEKKQALTSEFDSRLQEGFQKGLDLGKEEVERVSTGFKNTLAKLDNVISDLETTRKRVLEKSHDHFLEIAKALSETLIRREFKLDPAALTEMIQDIIANKVQSDKFQILVGKETFDSIKEADDIPMKLKERLLVDSNMAEGDFRVNSELATIDGNLSEQINTMIDGVDIDIFTDEKAG